MNRKFPDIHARIWPARFTKREDIHGDDEEEGEYQGCYLVGLAKGETDNMQQPMSESDRKSAHVALQVVLNGFAEKIRGDETYFDATSSWVDVTLVKQSEVRDLRIDDRDWGNAFAEEGPDSEDDEEGEGADGADEEDVDSNLDDLEEKSLALRPNTNRRAANTKSAGGSARLRPAGDILNRLRWDSGLDSSDYLVGYEDRFKGIREMATDRWKSEQTDEEFIPQHRIVYFKRKSDGTVVWDRMTRKDEIFGSGDRDQRG